MNHSKKDINTFILSTGRAGTTFLSRNIETMDVNVSNLHQDENSRYINVLSNASLKHKFFQTYLLKMIENKPSLLESKFDPLKSLLYYYYLKNLKESDYETFKTHQIIHLVRDPRDFVRSFVNWKNRKKSGKIVHHLIPFWMPKPTNKSFLYNLKMNKFEHFCWVWQIKNKMFYETFSNESNYQLFKFEDITTSQESLNDVVKGIVPEYSKTISLYTSKKINKSTLNKFPKWHNWSSDKCHLLDDICGEMMNVFDYGIEEDWIKKVRKHEE
jgi:hypothetical protein